MPGRDVWRYDPDKRLSSLAEVLQHVRLAFVSPYFLFDKIDTEALLSQTTECRRYLDEAKKYHVLKDRHAELQSALTKPRRCQATDRRIIMVGGEIHSKNYLNSVDGYSLDEGKWLRLKDLPFPRCHHGCIVSGGTHIYVTGGLNRDNVVLNNVLRYEPTLDKWIKVANMNKSRARHATASLDGCVYVLGGSDGESLIGSVERYTPAVNNWQSITSLPVALSRCQAAGSNGLLYIAGGTAGPNNEFVDTLYQYSPHEDVWNVISPMPVPRCLLALVAIGHSLYAVGGAEETSRASNRLSCYDVKADRWTDLAPMLEPKFDAGVASMDRKIYVLSGHDGENSFHHNIEEYDLATDTWTEMSTTNVPYGRCRFGCVALSVPPK
ncbi:hypothetical protein LSAT2_011423 [Lamellibrachia satsuma]|nr:hypothetical protein LSAT2_011423 [Lamellibrachia satsuma]